MGFESIIKRLSRLFGKLFGKPKKVFNGKVLPNGRQKNSNSKNFLSRYNTSIQHKIKRIFSSSLLPLYRLPKENPSKSQELSRQPVTPKTLISQWIMPN